MNEAYRRHHPKWYRARMPIFWWLRQLAYTRFIVRELTSLAVAYAALLLLAEVYVLGAGPDAFARFSAWLGSPFALVLHGLLLVALLFHSVTWINLAPRALVLRVARRRLSDAFIVLGHYIMWLAATVLLAWVLLRR